MSDAKEPVLRVDSVPAHALPKSNTNVFYPPTNGVLTQAAYDSQDGLPVMTVQSGNRQYRVFIGKWGPIAVATSKLLQSVGISGGHFAPVRGFKLSLAKYPAAKLAKFWANSPNPSSWSDVFGEAVGPQNPAELTIQNAWVEEIPSSATPFWKGDGTALFALAWLGNTDGLDDLRHSLGNTIVYSSVNLFTNWMFQHGSGANNATLAFDATDATYRSALEQISRSDAQYMALKISQLTATQIQSIFVNASFPIGLARLYSAKLGARFQDAVQVLKLKDPTGRALKALSVPSVTAVEDGAYIQDGELMENYPNFSADLTESVMETLFRRAEPTLLSGLDKAAQLAVSGPWTSSSYEYDSPDHTSAGGGFQIHRKIAPNPKPTGPMDQFIVTDEIDLSLSLAAVLKSLSEGVFTTSISPSWTRRYVFSHPVPTQEEAMKQGWLLPIQIIFKTNFQNLKNGDMLYIQDGLGVTGEIAAGLEMPKLAGFVQIPAGASGFLSAEGSYLSGHQLRYTASGLPTVVVDSGERVTAAAALYIRHSSSAFYARMLTYTVASLGWNAGTHHIVAYVLDSKKAAKLTALDKTHLNSDVRTSLADHEYDLLNSDFQKLTFDTNYTSDSALLDIGIFHANLKDTEASDTFTDQTPQKAAAKKEAYDPKHFFVVNAVRDRGTKSTDLGCTASGALEYSDVGQNDVADGVVAIECTQKQGATAGADAESSLRQVAEHFQVSDRAIDSLVSELPNTSEGMVTKVSVILTWSQVRTTVNSDVAVDPIVTADAYAPVNDSLYSGHNLEDSFEDVVKKLAKQGLSNSFRDSLLKTIGTPYVRIEVTADHETKETSVGHKTTGRAYKYLTDREAITSMILGE